MYPFAAKVTWFDCINSTHKISFMLLYGENFTEVTNCLENYCDLENVEIHCVGDVGQLFEVNEKIFNCAIVGNGNITEGAEILRSTEE